MKNPCNNLYTIERNGKTVWKGLTCDEVDSYRNNTDENFLIFYCKIKMITVKENEVYKRERKIQFTNEEIITFKIPVIQVYEKADYDWYMTVALEKIDKVIVDRHLLTAELIISYRNAIREGYQHQLDPNLRSSYDYPRNRNTINGITGYISKIFNNKL